LVRLLGSALGELDDIVKIHKLKLRKFLGPDHP
jgi:hypothetical protein